MPNAINSHSTKLCATACVGNKDGKDRIAIININPEDTPKKLTFPSSNK